MTSEYLGLRLNQKKHREIISWLDKFDDRSEEARRLMALGIRVSNGEYTNTKTTSEPIVWKVPEEKVKPTATKVKTKAVDAGKPNYKANILGSFDV